MRPPRISKPVAIALIVVGTSVLTVSVLALIF